MDIKCDKSEYVRCGVVYQPSDTLLEESVELYNAIFECLKTSKLYLLLGDFNLLDISWKIKLQDFRFPVNYSHFALSLVLKNV